MRTFEVIYTDGHAETVCAERIQFTPTHVVFDNTENSLGYGRFSLECAIQAAQVELVTETAAASWRKQIQAKAWREGYEAGSSDSSAWEDVTDGYVDFDEYEDTPNPYRDTP